MRKQQRALTRAIALAAPVGLIAVIVLATAGLSSGASNPSARSGGADTGVLRIAQSGVPEGFDPALLIDNRNIELAQNMYDGLVDVNASMKLVPALAKSWKVSKDGTLYTFSLRPGLTFQNGDPVTAADFVYTYNRSLSPKTASPTSFFLSDIKGSDKVLAGKAKSAAIRAIGKYTFQVKLSHPAGYFLSLASRWPAWVVDRKLVEKYGKNWASPPNVAGTGAYRLTEAIGDTKFVFTANPNYFRGRPRIQRVEVNAIPNSTAALARYQAGELDAIVGLSAASVLKINSDPTLKKEFHGRPLLRTIWLGFQNDKAPFNDVRVRQAFNYAIDKQAMIKIALAGQATPAVGWLPPGLPGSINGTTKGYTFDPTKAKALLAAAGFADGKGFPSIDLVYNLATGQYPEVYEFIQGQLQQNLGIKVGLKQMPANAFNAAMKDKGQRPLFWSYSFGLDYPDAQEQTTYLGITGAPYNFENYSNPRYDSLIKRANETTNQATRATLYRQSELLRLKDAAIVPLYYPNETWIAKPYVKNFEITPLYQRKWFEEQVTK